MVKSPSSSSSEDSYAFDKATYRRAMWKLFFWLLVATTVILLVHFGTPVIRCVIKHCL